MNGFQIAVLRMLAWLVTYIAQTHRTGSVNPGVLQKGLALADEAVRDCDQSEGTGTVLTFKQRVREVQGTLGLIAIEAAPSEGQKHIKEAISQLEQAIQNEPY
jgi:hypothetical protein